jgi:hypothetical protein
MRRPVKFTLVALAFTVTPFCWSVARDLLPLLFASEDAANVETGIAIQLAAEHERMHLGDAPPLASVILPDNCFSVAQADVQSRFRLLNKTIDGVDEESRSTPSIVSINAYIIPHAFFAKARGIEALQKNLSPIELAALNGCMVATPFDNWCDERIEKNMGYDFRLVEQDLIARGLARHAVDEQGRELLCTTIPVIESNGAQP